MKAGRFETIDIIKYAMNEHLDDAKVCEKGCWALRNITLKNGIFTFNI